MDSGALVVNILDVVGAPLGFVIPRARTKLVSDLQRSSKVLFAIGDRFVEKIGPIQMASFYETQRTMPLGKVVSIQSAKLQPMALRSVGGR